MNDKRMVNGKEVMLTDAEQADFDARSTAWESDAANRAAKAALPDLATQVAHLTAAVVNLGGTVPDAVITAVNDKLDAIGAPEISLQPISIGKIAP